MVDYVKLAATAERLIKANGRPIQFVKKGSTLIDEDKPWLGSNGEGEVKIDLHGVFVPPNTVRQFGLTALGEGTDYTDLVSVSEQICITSPGEHDLRSYPTLRDGTVEWGTIGIQLLKPGPTQILAFVGVKR